MNFKVTRTVKGHLVELEGAPTNLVALAPGPRVEGDAADEGAWIVVNVAVWSGQDLAAIRIAEDVARHATGWLRVGVRAFERHDQLSAWAPECAMRKRSPIWVFMFDGETLSEEAGVRSPETLLGMAEQCFAPYLTRKGSKPILERLENARGALTAIDELARELPSFAFVKAILAMLSKLEMVELTGAYARITAYGSEHLGEHLDRRRLRLGKTLTIKTTETENAPIALAGFTS